jgi:uncharacterized protein (DUF983 family)
MKFKLLKKGTKTYSVLKWKCPNCQEGDLFIYRSPYSFTKCLLMHEKCSECNQDFQIEPGFYYGSIWMSYPVVVLITIAVTSYFYLYLELPLMFFILILAAIMLSLQPLIVRFGRAMWLNIFVKYKKGRKY